MKAAILANTALCICPPLIAAAATIAVPPVRTAMHHLTAPHRHHPVKEHHNPTPCRPFKRATAAAGLPRDLNPLAEVLLPDDADASLDGATSKLSSGKPPSISEAGAAARAGAGIFPLGPGPILGPLPAAPIGPPVPQPSAAVPEPASWAMMVAGFLGVGLLIRKRAPSNGRRTLLRRASLATILELFSSAAFGSAHTAASTSVKAASTFKGAVAAAVAKKAAVCVCSGSILAAAVSTVPPLKRAVFSATMAAPAPLADCRSNS